MCSRCATSWATVARRTSGGANMRRQLYRIFPDEEQLPHRPLGSPIPTVPIVTPASSAISRVSRSSVLSASRFSQRTTRFESDSTCPPTMIRSGARWTVREAPARQSTKVIRPSSINVLPGAIVEAVGSRPSSVSIQSRRVSAQSSAARSEARRGSVSLTDPSRGSTASRICRDRGLTCTINCLCLPPPSKIGSARLNSALTARARQGDVRDRLHRPRKRSSPALKCPPHAPIPDRQ